ncbi:MAG: hypothetical protein PHZ00_03690 [Candidatus Peribacteraceae bacterium]|nr:hypothetical protein [Candidatus Peribacteraceae bacterium]
MSPILTDHQRKRVAKWLTSLIFGYLFRWLFPLFLGIAVFLFLVIGGFLAFVLIMS